MLKEVNSFGKRLLGKNELLVRSIDERVLHISKQLDFHVLPDKDIKPQALNATGLKSQQKLQNNISPYTKKLEGTKI